MSITALITGRLIAAPERRASANGKSFAVAKLAVATDGGDAVCSAIAFGSNADQLVAMAKGETVALSGRAKLSAWTSREGEPRAGLDLTVEQVLTVYHLRRKRQVMRPEDSGPEDDR